MYDYLNFVYLFGVPHNQTNMFEYADLMEKYKDKNAEMEKEFLNSEAFYAYLLEEMESLISTNQQIVINKQVKKLKELLKDNSFNLIT
jgi:hypothetical protein